MTDRLEQLAETARRYPKLLALLLGLTAALGYPPVHAWPIGLLSVAGLIWLIRDARDWRAALGRGWLFGWAHLTLANNWIATAFTYQAKMPELLGWAAVPLLCIYLAWYPALAALTAHVVAKRAGPLAFGLVFAAAWIVTEWLRSWVFTGYPWPPLGLMLLGGWSSPGIAMVLPWLGTYALSGMAVVLSSLLVWALCGHHWVRAGAGGLAVAAAMHFPGIVVTAPLEGVRYTLVQPLIPQDEINDASKFEEQFQRTAALTMEGNDRSRLVLWPESAIPDYLEDGYPERYYRAMTAGADPEFARERIARTIGAESTLLTGVVNLNIGMREDGNLAALSARNSVVGLNGTGDITHHYAKAHLVPYGEYLPMEEYLGLLGLARLTAGTVPYIPGPGPQTLDLGEHGKAGVQICYEIVFSGQVVDRDNRPDYLFNPSNDGWFGSWGPPQHLAQARMRAIEEGLPVLRSTTTGISAVIDANGIVRQHVPTGVSGKIDGVIPASRPPTLFARTGNALALAWVAILVLLALGVPRLLALREARS